MNEKHGAEAVVFQVSFFTNARDMKKFKRVTLPRAEMCPLPRQHRTKKYLIGCKDQIKQAHPYSVHQKLIVEFNNQPVIP